jgi:hypothetical protein
MLMFRTPFGRLIARAAVCLGILAVLHGQAASIDPAPVGLHKHSFLHGREYFVLRSGRAKLIVQVDLRRLGYGWHCHQDLVT